MIAKKPKARRARRRHATPAAPPALPEALRRGYIEVAAYFIAEHEGFAPGRALDHWLRAEIEIGEWTKTGPP